MSATIDNRLLTVREAAEVARVSDRTVRAWIKDQRLAATKTATGTFRIESRELARVLNVDDIHQQQD